MENHASPAAFRRAFRFGMGRVVATRPLKLAVGLFATSAAWTPLCPGLEAGTPPAIVSLTGTPAEHELSWNTRPGRNYLVEASSDLNTWTPLNIVQPGNGGMVHRCFSAPENTNLFYRIRERSGAVRPGFNQHSLTANDDSSTDMVSLGFPINLFGSRRNYCYVNNNGNITFDGAKSAFTPVPLKNLGFEIIAPFWADVDTIAPGSATVKYSNIGETVDGHRAFGVNWVNVGYFSGHDDKLNSFQLILIERSDTGADNFDIEFNYDSIVWETGDASNGINGYGGKPSLSGLSNGRNQTIELEHSGRSRLQLDSNPETGEANSSTGLIFRSRNSGVPGRFLFQVRGGQVLGALNVDAGPDQNLAPDSESAQLAGEANIATGEPVGVRWTLRDETPDVVFSDPTIPNPVITFPKGSTSIVLLLTAYNIADPTITAADTVILYR